MIRFVINPLIKQKKVEDLVDLPLVVTVNKFDEDSAKKFRDDFYKAVNFNSNLNMNIVPIIVDSFGGTVYSLLDMVDIIKDVQSQGIIVPTIARSKIMSCGVILFSCGSEGYRFFSPLATALIHDVSTASQGKVLDIETKAEECTRLNNLLYELLSVNCGKPKNYFGDIVHNVHGHADWYLNADDALSHNLANHIRTPNFNVNISLSLKFE
jgi:ATP-dependent protease ClpP protease subunit